MKLSSSSKIEWTRNNKLTAVGTSLCTELPRVSNEWVKALFGKLPKGAQSKVKYSESIVLTNNIETPVEGVGAFGEGVKGIYTLYTANGEWRIGSPDGQENEFTADLLKGFNF